MRRLAYTVSFVHMVHGSIAHVLSEESESEAGEGEEMGHSDEESYRRSENQSLCKQKKKTTVAATKVLAKKVRKK